AADLLPPTIVALEAWRTLVDRLGALRDRPATKCADPDQVAFRPFAVGRVEESIHEGPEVRIDGVPVEPDRPLEHAVVHHARNDIDSRRGEQASADGSARLTPCGRRP